MTYSKPSEVTLKSHLNVCVKVEQQLSIIIGQSQVTPIQGCDKVAILQRHFAGTFKPFSDASGGEKRR